MGGGGSKDKGNKGGGKSKGSKGGKKPKGGEITQHDKAVLDLKNQRDKLKQYHKKCDTVIERETEIAKELLKKGERRKALLALKKKKYQENLLAKSEAMLENIQEMIDSIEFTRMEHEVFEKLAEGNEVLKELHSIMTVEDVEHLMDETAEAIEYQREIEETLAEGFTTRDEEELEDELAALMGELEGEGLILPDAPLEDPEAEAEPAKQRAKAKGKKQAIAAS